MKRILAWLSISTLVAVLAVPMFAQSRSLKANIPFDFSAGSRALRAGEYTFDETGNSSTVLFRSADSRIAGYLSGQMSWAPFSTSRSEAKLVFHRIGDQYFLSRIVDADGNVRQLPMTHVERELTSQASSQAYDTVVVLARL